MNFFRLLRKTHIKVFFSTDTNAVRKRGNNSTNIIASFSHLCPQQLGYVVLWAHSSMLDSVFCIFLVIYFFSLSI